MFCPLYKWLTALSIDKKNLVSKWTDRHALRCRSCREYKEKFRSIPQRLKEDRTAYLASFPSSLPDSFSLKPTSVPSPLPTATHHARPLLKPVLAAAAGLMLLAAGTFLLKLPPFQSHLQAEMELPVRVSPASLTAIAKSMESPLEEELKSLTRTLESTGRFLISRLDIRINREKPM